MVSLLECRKEAIKAMDSNSCGSSITLPFLTPGSNPDGLDYDVFMVLNA